MSNALISFLKSFKDIPKGDEELLESIIEKRTYNEDEFLLKENTVAQEMFFICKGILKIVMLNDKGEEMTYFFLKENQFCTILNSFNNQSISTEGIKAACSAEVIVLPRVKLLEVFKQLPYIKELIGEITQQALLDKIQVRNNYIGQDAATRYKMFTTNQPEIALRVSIRDIASYLGVTPQSLSRIRKNIQ
jgi:CRP-like cAMP-binding protein